MDDELRDLIDELYEYGFVSGMDYMKKQSQRETMKCEVCQRRIWFWQKFCIYETQGMNIGRVHKGECSTLLRKLWYVIKDEQK